MRYQPLSEREEEIARKIVDAAYTVHKKLGRNKRFDFQHEDTKLK